MGMTDGAPARFESIEEWDLWKSEHVKNYINEKVAR